MPCKTGNRHRHEPTKSKPRRPWSCNYTRLTIHCYKRHKRDRDRFKRINVHLVTSHAPRLPPPGYRPLATAPWLLPFGCCPPAVALRSPWPWARLFNNANNNKKIINTEITTSSAAAAPPTTTLADDAGDVLAWIPLDRGSNWRSLTQLYFHHV